MFDSGASSNIITKKVMQQLNLNVTRPYHNVCALDSREIDTVGIILNLHVRLAAHHDITVVMDVLVIDVQDAWGILMSKKWVATLGGHIQMDLTYATIPAPDNTLVKLYREQERKFHVEDPKEPVNEYIYHVSDIGNYVICSKFLSPLKDKFKEEKVDEIWRIPFDGVHSRAGKGVGIVITSLVGQSFNFSFRLEFDATNNVAEYEALLLGLEIAKDMEIKILNIKGDSDLILLQVKNKFACKSERLRKYRNAI
jgi:hypothetical protein